MSTRRSGAASPGRGRSRSALATEKIVVFAPMPMASDSAAVTVNSGLWRSSRNPYRTSCQVVSSTRISSLWKYELSRIYGGEGERLTAHALLPSSVEASMPQGDKSAYTDKQKRKAEHIEEGYEERGVPEDEAERRAWATVNAMDRGGKKSGSGRGRRTNKAPARKGGRKGGRAA